MWTSTHTSTGCVAAIERTPSNSSLKRSSAAQIGVFVVLTGIGRSSGLFRNALHDESHQEVVLGIEHCAGHGSDVFRAPARLGIKPFQYLLNARRMGNTLLGRCAGQFDAGLAHRHREKRRRTRRKHTRFFLTNLTISRSCRPRYTDAARIRPSYGRGAPSRDLAIQAAVFTGISRAFDFASGTGIVTSRIPLLKAADTFSASAPLGSGIER
jgi:hypothetical protein